jgi:arylformamidase
VRIIDISQPLRIGIPPWPGDTEFSFDLVQTKEQGGPVNVGRILLSAHTGTHVDAPFHFDAAGEKVLDLDPAVYVGPARVIDASAHESVGAAELRGFSLGGFPRLLLKTGSWRDRNAFPESITHLRPDAAPFLAGRGVRLVGVDVPSVDPLDSKDLPAHHALHANGIHILEGVVLDGVEPGDYELVALPLALRDADGSPVRAVLRPLPGSPSA